MNKINILLSILFVLSLSGYSQTNNKVYDATEVDQTPLFAKGKMTLADFLKFYQQYPEYAKEKDIQGNVTLSLLISSEGEIVNSSIAKGLSESMDKEALRLADLMPMFTPAVKNGKNVSTRMTLQIPFNEGGAASAESSEIPTRTNPVNSSIKHPLYVIDGKIVNEDINVNADNIESVRVIKGKKAIERYGERAVDGVIVFKTKNTTNR